MVKCSTDWSIIIDIYLDVVIVERDTMRQTEREIDRQTDRETEGAQEQQGDKRFFYNYTIISDVRLRLFHLMCSQIRSQTKSLGEIT